MLATPRLRTAIVAVVATTLPVVASSAWAKKKRRPYPTESCVSAKQQAAGLYCQRALKAWAKWERKQNQGKLDDTLERAATALAAGWSKAEGKATAQGADCTETTLAPAAAVGLVGSAAGAIVTRLNSDLDPTDRRQARCGQRILQAAAAQCGTLLKAESKFLRQLGSPAASGKRDKARENGLQRFGKAWTRATRGCPATATETEIAGLVDDLVGALVRDTTASPSVPDSSYLVIAPTGTVEYEARTLTPVCMDGVSPYVYFAKRGTVNKLVMYYQGGGACWEQLTCGLPSCDPTADPVDDNPEFVTTGFADAANPANPFRDWHVVFVSYCSCDIHFGDAAQDYANTNPGAPLHVEHRGFQNAKVVEKWAREHFVSPEVVFVTGSSAGAYGAWFHAPLLHQVWPAARFHVLADAGNGVITQDFLDNFFPNWNFAGNVPPEFPEILDVLQQGGGIPDYTDAMAARFPTTNWAHYTTAFDGGTGGQTGFFNLMLNDNNPLEALTWWNGSCQFNAAMRQQAIDTAGRAPENYRYYIGTGSQHTMWGSNKVYDDTTGGVPTIVDWLDAMLQSEPGASDPAWTNAECTNCGLLLPGDPRPNPLQTPFTQVGSDVVIDCPGTP